MEIPVLVEQLGEHRYVARSGEPISLSADGETSDEAIRNLEGLMRQKLTNGSKLAAVRLPSGEENPWIAGAGCLKDDPLFDEWLEAMKEYRSQIEDDPNY